MEQPTVVSIDKWSLDIQVVFMTGFTVYRREMYKVPYNMCIEN